VNHRLPDLSGRSNHLSYKPEGTFFQNNIRLPEKRQKK
jgi:hypothetical protein